MWGESLFGGVALDIVIQSVGHLASDWLVGQLIKSSGFASCVSEQPPSNFELEDVRVRRSWTSDEGSFVKIDPDEEFAQEDREKSHSLKTREEFFVHDRLREDLEPEDLIDEVFEEDIEPEDKDHLLSLDSTACTSSRSSYDESVTLISSDNDAGVTVIDSDYVLGDSQPGSDTETQIKEKECQENCQDVCQEVNQSESESCQESVQDCKEKKIVSHESLEVISKEYQEVCDSATKECQKLCQENQCECTGQCQKDASENNQEDTQNIPVENFGKSEKSSYKGSQDLSNSCKNSDQEICIESCQNVCQKPCQEGCHESNPDTVVDRSTEYESLKDETETMGNKLCRKNSRDVQKATEKHPELSLLPIGEKQDIIAYATREWTGNTDRAETIRKGYSAIPQDLGLSHIRRVRGDNYCGIRASLYLALSAGIALPSGASVSKWLKSSYNAGSKWISDYNFGKRLQYSKDGLFEGIKDCLETMDKMVSDLRECENKASILRSMLNHDSVLDVRLCEAAKLLMLSASIDLYEELKKGAEVPLFASILFARESSVTPSQFLSNHLNAVGDTAGLEQVEMCLLGYALQVTLKVVRPSSYSSEDFVSSYPDDHLTDWPEVYLVAEDDRHYNVLVS